VLLCVKAATVYVGVPTKSIKMYYIALCNRLVSFNLTLPFFAYFVLVLPEDDPTMCRNVYQVCADNIILLSAKVVYDFTCYYRIQPNFGYMCR
jgi:hypothetical protein